MSQPENELIGIYLNEISQFPRLTESEEINLGRQIRAYNFIKEYYRCLEVYGQLFMQPGLDQETQNYVTASRLRALQIMDEYPQLISVSHQQQQDMLSRGELARQRFIKANTRLVIKEAKKMLGRGLPFTDLIQEGNIGLIKAVDRFDPDLGFQFSSLGVKYIHEEIRLATYQQHYNRRIPQYLEERINKLNKYQIEFLASNGREPTNQEIAEYLGLTPKQVEDTIFYSYREVSLHRPAGSTDEDTEIADHIIDNQSPDPESTSIENNFNQQVKNHVKSLQPKSQHLLIHRFGLNETEPQTLSEIGQQYNISREAVRIRQTVIFDRLRQNPELKQLYQDHFSPASSDSNP
jgi:RNA polymerase sigma factor (sigma-70 family)